MNAAKRKIIQSIAILVFLLTGNAYADRQGFQLMPEPTVAGSKNNLVNSLTFEEPFSLDLRLNYLNNYAMLTERTPGGSIKRVRPILEHGILGNFSVSGVIKQRVLLGLSLPMMFAEYGEPGLGISPLPGSRNAGDPRLDLGVRLYGRPDHNHFSASLLLHAWMPIHSWFDKAGTQLVESGWHFAPKLLLGGIEYIGGRKNQEAHHAFLWSAEVGGHYRPGSYLGPAQMGSQLQVGTTIGYSNIDRQFTLQAEAQVTTLLDVTGAPFQSHNTELLLFPLSANIKLGDFLLRAAAGTSFGGLIGAPNAMGVISASWQPGSGRKYDRDGDGVEDGKDQCPDIFSGELPDPQRPGCPARDRDGDGVPDARDLCPDVRAGAERDLTRPGCPAGDEDHDGIIDRLDECKSLPMGSHPDAARLGCPSADQDNDGVSDVEDACPTVAAGLYPDAARPGCPKDSDGDGVIDELDRCPQEAGPADNNGCFKKHEMQRIILTSKGIELKEQILFREKTAVLLPGSFELLEQVGNMLHEHPEVKWMEIQGHTDKRGTAKYNQILSIKRAAMVRAVLLGEKKAPTIKRRQMLVTHPINPQNVLLVSNGFGFCCPIGPNKTAAGRKANRHVSFNTDMSKQHQCLTTPVESTCAGLPEPDPTEKPVVVKKAKPKASKKPN